MGELVNDKPKRIQLRRTKGWRKPEGAIVVALPSKWGNPWRVVPRSRFEATVRTNDAIAGTFELYPRIPRTGAHYWAMQYYRLHLGEHPELMEAARTELRGHDLACWCPLDQPCHADVLLELVNSDA